MDPDAAERRVAVALLLATCASVYSVYLLRWSEGPWIDGAGGAAWRALGFTGALLSLLIVHELGHWIAGRARGVRLALPWFLPAPVWVGTLGAVIRWSDVPRTRGDLLSMAAWGPLAGTFAVALTVAGWLIFGTAAPADAEDTLGRPLLWWVLAGVLTGRAPPPVSPQDPVAFAAWIGALVTGLNLLPMGQLDGGHVVRALWPRLARRIHWGVTLAGLLAGWWWPGWAVWVGVANLLGREDEAPREAAAPGRREQALAAACVAAWGLCVTPVPM